MNNRYRVEEKTKHIVERLKQSAPSLKGRNRDILETLIQGLANSRSEAGNQAMSKFYELLWTDTCTSMSDIFAGEKHEILVALFGDALAEKVRAVWNRSADYIYSTGYGRRSWRSKEERLYLRPTVSKLIALLYLVEEGFSAESYDFAPPEEHYLLRSYYFSVVPDLLAYEIDEGNQAVKDRMREVIFADTTPGDDIRSVIKALLMSRDREAHEWVGSLLLAAKLQEGLRQAIVELMDQGTRAAFVYLLELILEHDLQRFSSVVRAFDVWTGLGVEAQKPTVVKKCLTAAHRCLTDEPYLADCLASDDSLLVYIGLWALAVDDVKATIPSLDQLLSAPETYKRTTALSFIEETSFPMLQHQVALPMMEDAMPEVKGLALRNLFGGATHPDAEMARRFGTDAERDGLFDLLLSFLQTLPKKEVRYEGTVFPWSFLTISQNDILEKMMVCSIANLTPQKFDTLMDLRGKMDVYTRSRFVTSFVKLMPSEKQRPAVLEFLGDKSADVRSKALKLAEDIHFHPEDYQAMEDLMRLKSGDLRQNIMSLLLRQPPEALLQSIERLAGEKNEHKQLAALDLIVSAEKDDKFQGIAEQTREIAVRIAGTTQKANALAQQLLNQERPHYTLENGLGLYDPHKQVDLDLPKCPGDESPLMDLPSLDKVSQWLVGLDRAVEAHQDYEYEVEWWDGSREKIVLGGRRALMPLHRKDRRNEGLENYPLPDVWRQTAVELEMTPLSLLAALFLFEYQPHSGQVHAWFDELTFKLFPYTRQSCQDTINNLKYPNHVQIILRGLFEELPKSEPFRLLCHMATGIVRSIPPERFAEEYRVPERYRFNHREYLFDASELYFWLLHLKQLVHDDAGFEAFFAVCYKVYRLSGYKSRTYLRLTDFERAYEAGLLDENELYAELAGRESSPDNIRIMSSPDSSYLKKEYESCHNLQGCCEVLIDRVLDMELNRGDLPTEVSHLAAKIQRCYGMKYLIEILITGEKETYTRGYSYASAGGTKKEMLSHILKNCYPADGENADTLRDLLNGRKVSEKQLIDAAMYAPQWLEIIEEYLGWPGLAMTGWYFHAHVGESFSNEKKTIVARYSPIEPDDFQYGAFDIRWFREAYDTLGDERFQLVYAGAKYIGGGALHRRSQLFADAVLGHISVPQAEKEIREKRNKDYVLVLGLIPLASGKQDMLARYEFLQAFLKESKQFGAQRRESEAKAVSFALENLARNAGYTDTNRFTWSMETEQMAALAPYLKPMRVDDVDLCLSVNERGEASLLVEKNGKPLKSIPPRLKKNETVVTCKEILKSLKDQYARARSSLENAMVSESAFRLNELTELERHPVIRPLLHDLVFKSDEGLGFFRDGALVDADGTRIEVRPDESLLIAHPVHLYESGLWSAFQRDVVRRQVIQPFKQVFRELYRPNADELASKLHSKRYAGHQIQPKRTVALLRGRGWTVSYEEGLQRVYHAENVIGHMYALADWFSPADVEAPTLEEVHFTERKTGKLLPFDQIPPVIFSEVMRDVDLVVSVAHVGGVDPEASHSTVEMRTVLVEEMIRLLKLENVRLKGTHAHIAGQLGDYTVHLGSGQVHKMASGAVHILPVHSQHRGRIFLPFVDDDPRTAEIISKITMLAEDRKIKDPNILEQLRG